MNMETWLPLVFVGLMALAILVYVVLDGYDLGVGLLLPLGDEAQKDTMIASIGPFWDANETWLVLGIGLLLVAFPSAHGLILGELYLPVMFMLVGLTFRGVAFEFRAKAPGHHKQAWNTTFFVGSLVASLAQGWMLGSWVLGFPNDWTGWVFPALTAISLCGGYALLGSGWLLMKTEGELRQKAARHARWALGLTGVGIAAVSLATPIASPLIFERWFSWPNLAYLAWVPIASTAVFVVTWVAIQRLTPQPRRKDAGIFAGALGLFMLAFGGLGYSMFPYLVIGEMTYLEAAAAPGSLLIMFVGAMVTLPIIIAYSVFSYKVFWGRTQGLTY